MAELINTTAWGDKSIAWVDSANVRPALRLAEQGKVDGLGISPHKGYASEDLSFLKDASHIQGVVMPYAESYDLRALDALTNLRFLSVAGNKQEIDYGGFPRLEDLRIEWHPKVVLPPAEAKLRSLYLRSYKPRPKNLTDLPFFENLLELEINQGNLTALVGVEHLRKLTGASFFFLRKLTTVGALGQVPIVRLHIEGCKTVSDIRALQTCPKLKVLRYIDCGQLSSLRFLNQFPVLEEFRFVKTNIEDADMTPLLRLKSVGFLKQARYSHTPEEIRESLGTNGDADRHR